MAQDELISDDPDFFLEYLLRCALTAPGADTSPTAGRILARLLVVGAIEGGDDLITPYLVPMPEEDATFEVRTYRPGDLVPTDVRDGLRAAAALKVALREARDSDEGIEVVSRTESGLERCALVRDSTGDFEFRFAGPETLVGPPEECRAARSAWEATLASWRAWVPGEAPDGEEHRWWQQLAPERDADASLEVSEWEFGRGRGVVRDARQGADDDTMGLRYEAASGWWVPTSPAGGEPPARIADPDPGAVPVPPEPEADVLGSPIPQPGSPPPPPAQPLPAQPRLPQPPPPQPPPPPPPQPPPQRPPSEHPPAEPRATASAEPALPPSPDVLAGTVDEPLRAAIREAIANLVVEVDLGQVEQLIRRALDDDRRELVEPLARRLSARLGETLDLPDTAHLVEAMSMVVPRPDELAEVVAADIGALLSETILRRRPGDSGAGADGMHVMAGIEQLQVRLDGLQDQLQKSASLLQALGDHLAAGDRRAAITERITASVDQEMQRLAGRIDEQVSALAATAGGGSELADGVARLTRKLRQSVAQFDRALVRLDEMVDQAEAEQARRRALARGNEPAAPGRPARPAGAGPLGPAARR